MIGKALVQSKQYYEETPCQKYIKEQNGDRCTARFLMNTIYGFSI